MKKIIALILAAMLFSSCSAGTETYKTTAVTTITNADTIALAPRVDVPDPETALTKIYENIKISDVKEADARVLSKTFGMNTALMQDSFVRYTSGKFGLANTFILQPKTEEDVNNLRDQLEQVKLAISRETEHYDIYNAYQTAQDAQIFEQGGYVIMLMMPDIEAARKMIDTYIPKK